jgi:hypothetical protein
MLVVLGVVALLFVWIFSGEDLPGVPRTGDTDGAGGIRVNSPPVVQMALLTRAAEDYDPAGRDLFKYGQRPAPPPDPDIERRKQEAAKRREEARRKAEAKPPPPPRPTGPRPPRIDFAYLGYLGPKDDKIAVFEENQEVTLARAGETLYDNFRVVDIQYESVVIGFTDPRFEARTETLSPPVTSSSKRRKGR